MTRALVVRGAQVQRSGTAVTYLTPAEVDQLAEAASRARNGARDRLLIRVLFETGLRISEALQLTPSRIQHFEGEPVLAIVGKGNKPRRVSCPSGLAESLQAYAYRMCLGPNGRFFPINRQRGHQIIAAAAAAAGLQKRVYPHLLRHSDAVERLRQTGNPKALQLHLGHSSPLMTMRYLSTLAEEDALRVQASVTFNR